MVSLIAIEVSGHRDHVFGVVPAASDKHTLATAQIDLLPVQAFEPRVLVPVGEEEEQAFHLHILAIGEECLQAGRAQCRQALHHHVDLMEALAIGQFIEKFEDRTLGRRDDERPVPLSPRSRREAGRPAGI